MVILTTEDLREYISNYNGETDLSFRLNNPLNESERRFSKYKELLDYQQFSGTCQGAVEDLRKILSNNKQLNCKPVRDWVGLHKPLFIKHLLFFGHDYLDSGNLQYGHLHIPYFDEYVESTDYIPLIKFWECMWFFIGWFGNNNEQTQNNRVDYYSDGTVMSDSEAYTNISSMLNRQV